ncbi:MAG: hypothetical protein MUF01_08560 [Bryobacterales bacterium]|nr:hypothetical protein [Bryobacterales bacterium]
MPPVLITLGTTPGSPWAVQPDVEQQQLLVTHRGYPQLLFEIDADGPEDDGRFEGITIVRDGIRFEGRLYANRVSFLSPDHDAGRTTHVAVKALDKHLVVRFDGGSFRKLNVVGPDSTVMFEAVFFVDSQHRLGAVLNGLYYVFPSATNTTIILTSRREEVSRFVNPQTHKHYEYFEQVTKVDVADALFGNFQLEGLIERLQLHTHGSKHADVFELDLDHSYKDRGQKEVLLRFLLAQPLVPASRAGAGATP